MNKAKRSVCKIFVDDRLQNVTMIATVKVTQKANFEKVQAIGEDKIIGFLENGQFYEITLSLFGECREFDNIKKFSLTIDYGDETEKYRNCIVTDMQRIVDSKEQFLKQKIVIASCERE